MNKEKALKNQGLEFREDILIEGGAGELKCRRHFLFGTVLFFNVTKAFDICVVYEYRHTQ